MRKLRKSEINQIIKENSALSNENLLNKYFDIIYHDVLGSQSEQMDEAGWDESDVKERREYEHYMGCYADVLEEMLQERGIDPWKDFAEEMKGGELKWDIDIICTRFRKSKWRKFWSVKQTKTGLTLQS